MADIEANAAPASVTADITPRPVLAPGEVTSLLTPQPGTAGAFFEQQQQPAPKYTPTAGELADAKTVNEQPESYTPTEEELQGAKQEEAPFSPLKDLSADQLFQEAMKNPSSLDPVTLFQNSPPSIQADSAIRTKAEDVYNRLQQTGFYVPGAGQILKNVGSGLWDLAKTGAYFVRTLQSLPVLGPEMAKEAVTGKGVDTSTFAGALMQQQQREAGEFLAGQKMAGLQMGRLPIRAAAWTARKLGIAKDFADYTPTEKAIAFSNELSVRKGMQRIATQGIAPDRQAALEEAAKNYGDNVALRPEKVETYASGSPFAWEGMGEAFNLAGGLVKAGIKGYAKLAPAAAEESLIASLNVPTISETVQAGARKAIGIPLQAAGTALSGLAKGTEAVAPRVGQISGGAAGGVAGAHLGPGGAVIGAAEGLEKGLKLGQKVATGAEKVQGVAQNLAQAGKEISQQILPTSRLARLGQDVAAATPQALAQLGTGAALDIGLQAATTETPAERESFTPFGTTFGVLGASRALGMRALSGQIVGPRDFGSAVRVPSTGNFPALAGLHDAAYSAAPEGIQRRVNAIRSFISGVDPGAEFFYVPHGGEADQLPALFKQLGLPEEWAQQGGVTPYNTSFTGADGQQHRLIIARDIDAAPHEAIHANDNVLGDTAVRELNAAAKDQYSPMWDQLTQNYANQVGGTQIKDPHSFLLSATGKGDALAKEKIINRVAADLGDSGPVPTDQQIHEASEPILRQHMAAAQEKGEALWQSELTPEEQQFAVDQIIGNEIRAENGDAWLKAGQDPKTLGGKMWRSLADTVNFLGGNPLEGRTSEAQGVPLSYEMIRGLGETINKARPTIQPSQLPKVKAPIGSPQAIAQQEDRNKAIVESAPQVKLPGAAKTQAEMMGVLNQARLGGGSVSIQYGHAPGDPAAAALGGISRGARRQVIEAYRNMPADVRAFWGTMFSPEGFNLTKQGKYQVYGGSHAVFSANAQKLAEFSLAHPDFQLPAGLQVDPNTKSFTPQSWDTLLNNLQRFSFNQLHGRTGSGEELVVPRMKGYYAPPVTGEALPIAQDMADVINGLYGTQTPETARITKADIVPLNIAGQRISQATLPGRVAAPTEASPVFGEGTVESGERAKGLGIAGEHVLETNPFLARLNEFADAPSFIEARQRLNLDSMADVNHAPVGAPGLRGNTLTLAAGFAPSTEPRAVKTAAVRDDRTGKIYEGPFHGGAMLKYLLDTNPGMTEDNVWDALHSQPGVTEGFTTNTPGEFLNRDQAAARAQELKQMATGYAGFPLESTAFEREKKLRAQGYNTNQGQFQPAKEAFSKRYLAAPAKMKAPEGLEVVQPDERVYASSWVMPDGKAYRVDADSEKFYHDDSAQGFTEFDTGGGVANATDFQDKAGAMRVAIHNSPRAIDDYGGEVGISVSKKPTESQADYIRSLVLSEREPGEFHANNIGVDITDAEGNVKAAQVFENFGKMTAGQILRFLNNPPVAPEAQFQPRREIQLEGPDGKKYRALFDGMQDFSVLGKGMVPQITPLENLPGATVAGSTTYGPSLTAKGFKLPDLTAQFAPNKDLQTLAQDYTKERGLPYTAPTALAPLNVDLGRRVADWYQAARSEPENPRVVAAYDAFKRDTLDQWNKLQQAGYTMEPWTGKGQPYANSAQMTADVQNNKHLWFFPTAAGYGEGAPPVAHPMLEDSGVTVNGQPLLQNDLFRAVHDAFGHAKEGYEFGPRGEYNAYLSHSQMYSPEARPAMASETLGQNSWVNFGPHMRNEAGELIQKGQPGFLAAPERPFSEQKAVILPEGQFQPKTFIVRHGSTEMNNADPKKDLIRGHINVPLDKKGRAEAVDTAQQIASQGGVQHIVSSDLDRTMSTAAEISKQNGGAPIRPDAGLRPWNFGPTIEGKVTADMLPKIAELTANPDQRPPGGETFNEFKDRFLDAFHRAQADNADKNTAIVTHYRGTKLLDAWRATGVNNDTIDPKVFAQYDKAKKPGNIDVVDKTGVAFSPRKKEETEPLIHYTGAEGIKTLEPEFHGTGLAGAESARKKDYPELWVPRTYFGTKGYEKEPGLGDLRYKAEVRSGKIYDFQEDPQGLYPSSAELEQVGYAPMDSRAAVSLYEKRIRDAGFEGYVNRDAKAVAKFTPTAVKAMSPEASFQRRIPTAEDFRDKDRLRDTLEHGQYSIFSATQEAKGKGTDEVNRLANENLEKALIADGYNPIQVKGSYKGEDQGLSFIVPGMSAKEAQRYGNLYGQESVIVPEGLLYGDNTLTPAIHSKTVVGPEAEKEDFYSKPEGGPAFSIGLDFASPRQPFAAQFSPKANVPASIEREIAETPSQEIQGTVPVARTAEKAARSRTRAPEEGQSLSLDYVLKNPDMEKYAKTVADHFTTIPGFKNIKTDDVPKALKEISNRLQNNLEFLYKETSPADRDKWKQWYDIAKKMTEDWAPDYELNPHTVAAINAKLSPQMPWERNITLTRAVLDTFKKDPTFTEADRLFLQEKFDAIKDPKERAKMNGELEGIKEGDRLSSLNNTQAGMFLRSHNELTRTLLTINHNLEVTPDSITGWNKAFDELRDVASIYRDPTYENVSRTMGGNHKVRSFYNNHVAPESPLYTTIDTHAVAAALMIPYGGSDAPVKANFGNPQHLASGYRGTYFLYQDAYSKAAEKLGILPRELQSIVWEKMRNLLSPEGKRLLQREDFKPIQEIYRMIDSKKISPTEGRQMLLETFQDANEGVLNQPRLNLVSPVARK